MTATIPSPVVPGSAPCMTAAIPSPVVPEGMELLPGRNQERFHSVSKCSAQVLLLMQTLMQTYRLPLQKTQLSAAAPYSTFPSPPGCSARPEVSAKKPSWGQCWAGEQKASSFSFIYEESLANLNESWVLLSPPHKVLDSKVHPSRGSSDLSPPN